MSLKLDLEQILEIALPTDPSFQRVERAALDSCIAEARRHALNGSKEAFLVSAMRLMALPRNGHTRLIPNNAISVLPLRFVSVGTSVHLALSAPDIPAPSGELLAVNGTPLSHIEKAAEPLLAGTRQRKRVIWPVLLVWPYALAHLGYPSEGGTTAYRLRDETGTITNLEVDNGNTVPASTLYPRNEHGKSDPAWEPETFAEISDWKGLGLSIRLPSSFDPSERALSEAISNAAERVRANPDATILIDVRGNTGGDFLKTMPLIDAISERADRQVVALGDKFTFSAAIVFVAILKHRLGGSLKIFGEEMGDGLTFFAEGGLFDLPTSGATVRYSSAFHDWKDGTTDGTTPPEIARHMVPAGALDLDRQWVVDLADAGAEGDLHRKILGSLNT